MIFGRPTRRELLKENAHLLASLDQARALLSRYREQEQDLIELLLRARADSRQALEEARAEARQIVEHATEESRRLLEDARVEIERELARLRDAQIAGGVAPREPATGGTRTITAIPVDAVGARVRHETPDLADPAAAPVADDAPFDIDALPPYEPVTGTRPLTAGTIETRTPSRVTPARMTAALVVLAAAGVLAWKAWDGRAAPSNSPTDTMVAGTLGSAPAPEVRASEAAPPASTAVAAPPTGAAAQVAPIEESPVATGLLAPREGDAAAPKIVQPNGVVVALETTRPAWVRAMVDGRRELARIVRPGEHLEFRAARAVELRAGDAGAVLVAVDGGSSAALGRDGAVLTTRIPAAEPGVARPPAEPPAARPAASASSPRSDALSPVATPSQVRTEAATVSSMGGERRTPRAPLPEPAPARGSAPTAAPAVAPPASPREPPAAPAPAARTAEDPAGDPGPTRVETAVLRAHQDYFDALRRNDLAAMRRLQAKTFTGSGTPPPGSALAVGTVSVQVSGVGAVVSGTASFDVVTPDGRPSSQPLMFSELWTNLEGTWQLLSVRFAEAPGRR